MPRLERMSNDSVISRGGGMLPTPPRISELQQTQDNAAAALRGRAPPPLCPSLVMPHCEAWFSISVERLMQGPGSFEILGMSGTALLRAELLHTDAGGREVMIAMTPVASPILASVAASRGSANLVLRGADGKVYGEIRPAAGFSGQYSLVISETEVLGVSFEAHSGRIAIFNPATRSTLATASRGRDLDSGTEIVEVCVDPGVDAVLILCCVLGTLLFGGGQPGPTGQAMFVAG